MEKENTPAQEVKKLDDWACGFLCGTVFGVLFTVGVLWAIAEKLK